MTNQAEHDENIWANNYTIKNSENVKISQNVCLNITQGPKMV